MKMQWAILFSVLFVFVLLSIQACSNPTRRLLSVTISPASGTPGGSSSQVQFVATGHYNTSPYTVTPLAATWGVANPGNQTVATTSQSGLATCSASGSTTVVAWVLPPPRGPVCNVIGPGGVPCGAIAGTAKLTCP